MNAFLRLLLQVGDFVWFEPLFLPPRSGRQGKQGGQDIFTAEAQRAQSFAEKK
jgi:hypothetical protein